MDFGVLGFDPSSDIHTNLKWNNTTPDDDHFRDLKLPKITTTSTSTFNSNNMLCFSSPNFPYHSRNSGTGYGVGVSSGMMMMSAASGFTPSQWMELEHQALIYKYITANVPIPSYLLNPIRKAFDSAPFPPLRSTSLGWGAAFHMGFSSTDPEPGRCRRTDGKKWRCSRDAVADQKYCERHMNRGRHRSRKPVEPSTAGATTTNTPVAASTSAGGSAASTVSRNKEIADEAYRHTTTVLSMMSPKTNIKNKNNSNGYEDPARPEFGLVCSDSLLNPLIKSSSLANYRTYNDNNDNHKPTTQLSISIPTTSDNHLEMGLGVGIGGSQHNRQVTNWVPISWEPSIGGPLGEALHTTTAECKPLNLIDGWDNHNHSHGSRIAPSSSPTGVLQRGSCGSLSNSSAGSSPRAETSKNNNNPYLPAI